MTPCWRALLALAASLSLCSCIEPAFAPAPGAVDRDGDGAIGGNECDDNDPTVFLDAEELCDGLDNDCDGTADEGLSTDADGDGHYREGDCAQPADDCDDADPVTWGGAEELCDQRDNDCDGVVDNELDYAVWYPDIDGDGFGSNEGQEERCDGPPAPTGWVQQPGDCDDSEPLAHPGRVELCDGIDNDCLGGVDDGLSTDADGDGHYLPGSCNEPADDCDDDDGVRWPENEEVCDEVDNDCDFEVDEGLSTDADGDGHTTPGSCIGPDDDCDDGDPTVFGGAPELCDSADNDCNGIPDDEVDFVDWYVDSDGDGYGDPGEDSLVDCSQPEPGRVTNNDDCDDGDAAVNPAPDTPELCNGIDDDCDRLMDAADPETDLDLDGISVCDDDCDDLDPTSYPGALEICDGPIASLNADNDCDGVLDDADEEDGDGVPVCEDCDDLDPENFPGNVEICDGQDNDCLGDIDEDDDLDGTGVCDDCDDSDPDRFPDNPEVCDGIDNDCNDLVDEGLTTDADGDGATRPDSCEGSRDDCDDGNGDVFPGAEELCDGLDNDCDDNIPENEADADGDGFAICAGDCDDGNPETNPEAAEICDGQDNDCDDLTPEDEADDDADGQRICGGDCDDSAPTVFDGAAQLCDGIDNTCGDGLPSAEVDGDGDGWVPCTPWVGTSGEINGGNDCEDAVPSVHPGIDESCDGVDNNCNELVDELDPDVYGTPSVFVTREREDGRYAVHAIQRSGEGSWNEEEVIPSWNPWTGLFPVDPDGDGVPGLMGIKGNGNLRWAFRTCAPDSASADANGVVWNDIFPGGAPIEGRLVGAGPFTGGEPTFILADDTTGSLAIAQLLSTSASGVPTYSYLTGSVALDSVLLDYWGPVLPSPDVDGDGNLDLLVCGWDASPSSPNTQCELLWGDGDGTFDGMPRLSFELPVGGDVRSRSVTSADLDLDGNPELIFGLDPGEGDGQIYSTEWNGSGWNAAVVVLDLGTTTALDTTGILGAMDQTGDGEVDLFVGIPVSLGFVDYQLHLGMSGEFEETSESISSSFGPVDSSDALAPQPFGMFSP